MVSAELARLVQDCSGAHMQIYRCIILVDTRCPVIVFRFVVFHTFLPVAKMKHT